ncbi:unnamed protein product [Cladocopium goreaui]|uniref:Uncharacterized protein n=1 Tax=Cladocopium goreaui TaxID=2562237 RepID=A0A9P1FMC8_9DINO|nr:unnamed protein product [Cladocopium goreaui]
MASSSSSGKYDAVIKSGLKLKGGDKNKEVGVKVAKKKKKTQEDVLTEQLQANADQELQEQAELTKGATQGPTTAQKTFKLAREKRSNQRINEAIQYTHRQRMDKLNAHLGSLTAGSRPTLHDGANGRWMDCTVELAETPGGDVRKRARKKLGKKELERIKGAEAGPPKEEPRESAPVNVLPVDQVASLGPGPAEAVTAP